MRPLPPPLLEIAQHQAGVVRMSQLAAQGFSNREVEVRVRNGLWRRVSTRVVALQIGPVERKGLLWAASLHHERVGLTGEAALELLGFPAPRNGRIELLGPRGTRQLPFAGCVLATSPTANFITEGGPMRTSPEFSVAWAMGGASSERQAVYFCTWAVQRRLVTLESVRAGIAGVSNSPRMIRALRVLDVIDPGVHSVHEHDFALECGRRGLPEPFRQVRHTEPDGRLRFTDAEFHVAGRVLIVEIDGAGHLDAHVREDDQLRQNELTIEGHAVLRIPALGLRSNPDRYFGQIQRALSRLAAASR